MSLKKQEILEEYTRYVSNIPNGLKELLNDIEEENFGNVNMKVGFLAEGLQWMFSVENYLKTQKVYLKSDIKNLNNILEDFMKGLEKRDKVLMLDIIEYELIPYFENLKVEN